MLARRQSHLNDCELELRNLNDTVQQTTQDVRLHHLTGELDMSFLAAHRRFMLGMQRQVLAIAQKIAAAQKLVDEARIALLEAAKQRKILEKLRERHHERWLAEQHRRELIEQDEIGMQLSYANFLADASGETERSS